jgi:uncharacterized protein with HEPN domain
LNLITIGEIATRLMSEHPDVVANHPDTPWRQMRGMRNRMAHGYFDINPRDSVGYRPDIVTATRAATEKRQSLRRASVCCGRD